MKYLFTLTSIIGFLLFPQLGKAAGPLKAKDMDKVIRKAESYLGTPYKYGGNGRRGIDCSGLMKNSFASVKYTIPRTSREQQRLGESISKNDIQRGDMIFFTTKGSRVNHVGLVTKVTRNDVKFIHSTSSRGVIVSSLNEKYWRKRYHSAKRLWQEERRRRRRDRVEEERPVVIRINKKVEDVEAPARETAPVKTYKKKERTVVKAQKKGQKEALKTEKPFIQYEEKKKALATVRYPGRFPQASQRDLSLSELRSMDPNRLTLMKYEVLARHGYKFTSPSLQRYFGMQDWYRAMPKENSKKKIIRELTPVEKANIKKIRAIELEKKPDGGEEFLIDKKMLMKRSK
ncbi:MAG: NlpC/P60 family protein [Bacteroidota bacterium]